MQLAKIDIDLIKLITQLNPSQKADLAIYLNEILKNKSDSGRQSIVNYNLELDQALQRIKDGKFTSLEELEKEIETW